MRQLRTVMAMLFALVEAIGMAAEVVETEKMLPLVQDVDVVVVGGSSGAVAAACKAAEAGAKVFLVAPRPYLGEDLAGTLRLGPDTTEDRRGGLYDIGLVNDTDAADLCFFALRSRLSMDTNVRDQTQIVNNRDRYEIRLVWSLGAAAFTDTRLEPGKGWGFGEEQDRELISNPESRGRKLLYQYIDETVKRYKHRQAVLLWEISNEVTLSADIGDRHGVFQGQRMPTLKDVAGFFDDVARRIKALDPLRLVNSGGSHMRESQWHLYQRQGWKKDTFEEQFQCFQLLYANSAVDVIDIHSYPNNQPGYFIRGDDGNETLLDHRGYMAIARRLGKPLMIGELGLHAAARTEKKIWEDTPDYFESYDDLAAAKPWVEKTLNSIIDAGVPLAYWWCYQSDRPTDQGHRQRFDIDRHRNPELLACFVDANQRLKAKLDACCVTAIRWWR